MSSRKKKAPRLQKPRAGSIPWLANRPGPGEMGSTIGPDFKIRNPEDIITDSSLSEPDQCRQMCYQLSYQMMKQDFVDRGQPFDHELLDAIALETVRQCFQNQPPSPGELAGLHPMMVDILNKPKIAI